MKLADRLERWTNPLLVKELHQGLRSRGLALGAMGSLVLCVGSYVLFALEADYDTQPGTSLAGVVGFCLCAVTLVILPSGMRAQLAQDFTSRTFELVRVAGLSSWRLAAGLYLGGMARVVFTVALMAPFLVATVLGGGLVFAQILAGLVLVLGAASIAVAGIVALGALAEGSPLGRLLGRGLPVLPFLWLFFAGSLGTAMLNPYGMPNIGAVIASIVTISVVGTLFLLRLGADALTPEGVRTFLGTKVVLVLAVAGWTAVLLAADDGRGDDTIVYYATFGGGPWLVGMLATRPGPASARLPWPVRDGFGPGLLLAAALLVGIGGAFAASAGDGTLLRLGARLALAFVETSAITRLLHALFDRRRADGALFLLLWGFVATTLIGLAMFAEILDEVAHLQVPWAIGACLPSTFRYASFETRLGWEIYPLALSAACVSLARLREVRDGR